MSPVLWYDSRSGAHGEFSLQDDPSSEDILTYLTLSTVLSYILYSESVSLVNHVYLHSLSGSQMTQAETKLY